MSKATSSLGIVRRAGKVFNCLRVLKSCFISYLLCSLDKRYESPTEHTPVWMSSAKSFLGLLDSIFRSAERLCEGELCCLRHRKVISALGLLDKIYDRVDYRMNEYLNYFVAARNTRATAALDELVLVMSRCRTDEFSRSFLPALVRL